MKKTPAELKAARNYYNKKVAAGYTQLNVLVKKNIVSALKQYAINNNSSIQIVLAEILKKGLNISDETKNGQEKPLSSWD